MDDKSVEIVHSPTESKDAESEDKYDEDAYMSVQLDELIELEKDNNNKLNRIIELLEASILE